MRRVAIRRTLRPTLWASLVLLLALPTGCALFFRGPILPPEPLPTSAIVDMHCHVAGLGEDNSGCYVSDRLLKSWKFGFYLRGFGISHREVKAKGDSLCADRVAEVLAASSH